MFHNKYYFLILLSLHNIYAHLYRFMERNKLFLEDETYVNYRDGFSIPSDVSKKNIVCITLVTVIGRKYTTLELNRA